MRNELRSNAFAPLRERQFRWYFLSRSVNLAGATLAPVALAFAVLEVSNSAAALGSVLAARSVPTVVFLLAGGVIADRVGRIPLIQCANLASAATQGILAVLLITGRAELWHFVVLSALNGTFSAASLPAISGIVPALVPRDQLQSANVLISMSRSALMIIGPSVGAVLVVTVGPGWALAIDAAAWLVAAALLLPVADRSSHKQTKSTVFGDLSAGWALFRQTTWLWVVVVTFGLLNVVHTACLDTLGPVLAKESDIHESGWGVIMSAQAGGLFLMTIILLRVRLPFPLRWGLLGISLFGAPLIVMGAYPHVGAVVVAAVVAGMGMEVFSLGWNLAMQENIPEEMLSRAYSYDMLGSFVAIPVGQLAAGPLAATFGLNDVMLTGGVVYVVMALLPLLAPSVRNLRRADDSLTEGDRRPGTTAMSP